MNRKTLSILALLLCLCILAGCAPEALPEQTKPAPTQATTEAPTEESTVPTVMQTLEETVAAIAFEEYLLTVRSPKLAIHSGPGYSYETVDHITDQGIYTIVAHETELLGSDQQTTWGKLKSGVGWINLDDAVAGGFESYLIKIEHPYLPIYAGPGYDYRINRYISDNGTYTIVEESVEFLSAGWYTVWGKLKSGAGWINLEDAKLIIPDARCTECGKSDDYVDRFGICQDCYHAQIAATGKCEYCGAELEEAQLKDRRCDKCVVCVQCGKYIHHAGDVDSDQSACNDCFYIYCIVCGANCTYRGVEENGMCEDCYDAQPKDCRNCNRGSIPLNADGLCESCAAGKCYLCQGPLGDNHNCDDYPNVFCPNGDWSMFTTGVGTDGFVCPVCGTHFMP